MWGQCGRTFEGLRGSSFHRQGASPLMYEVYFSTTVASARSRAVIVKAQTQAMGTLAKALRLVQSEVFRNFFSPRNGQSLEELEMITDARC